MTRTIEIHPLDDLQITVDGQPVLLISEVSDDTTINLFLSPTNGSKLVRSTLSKHHNVVEVIATRCV